MKKLKSVLTWVIRCLIVPAGFMYAVGTIDFLKFVHRMNQQSTLEAKNRFSKEELATLEITPLNYESYLDSIMELRQQQIARDHINDKNLYFHDLKQFDMFLAIYQDSLDHDLQGSGRGKLWAFNSKKQEIIDLSLRVSTSTLSEEMQKKHWKDIDKYRAVYFPTKVKQQKDTDSMTWVTVGSWFLNWFTNLYLKGMLFAGILFLFWRKRLKRKTEARLGVMSLVSSLVIWPVIIGMDIKNRFSEFMSMTDVVSRRNAMLSLFSKQELKLIEKSKQMSRVEFSKYLDSLNMTRKHSLWLSFVVVVIISITPKTALAGVRVMNAKITTVEKVFHTLDWDIGDTSCMYSEQEDVHIVVVKNLKKFFSVYIAAKLCKGYVRDIGGIPRFEISFS